MNINCLKKLDHFEHENLFLQGQTVKLFWTYYHYIVDDKNPHRIGFLMPPDGGERGGMVVTILLVIVSIFLSVVQTVPSGNKFSFM